MLTKDSMPYNEALDLVVDYAARVVEYRFVIGEEAARLSEAVELIKERTMINRTI